MKIGFIGIGNMGGAIMKGYANSHNENDILAFDTDKKKLEQAQKIGVQSCSSIENLVSVCDCIMLCVEPKNFKIILPQVASQYSKDKVVISIAAGITLDFLKQYLGDDAKLIRIMPNIPAMVGEAMIAVCPGTQIKKEDLDFAMTIFNSVGKAHVVDEELIHCSIGVSGSSPAYTYMYIEALMDAAEQNGMDREAAKIFAVQSVIGAAKMVLESDDTPEQLRMNVCSPGGTTIEAVERLMANDFMGDVKDGFQAAVDKSKVMSK